MFHPLGVKIRVNLEETKLIYFIYFSSFTASQFRTVK